MKLTKFIICGIFLTIISLFCLSNNTYAAEKDKTTEKFIEEIKDYAMELAYDNDLYASVMMAQAILESGSGTSTLTVNDNNLFGVKGSYNGKSARYWTYEDDGSGNLHQIKAAFRKYPSYKESLEDYVELLKNGLGGDYSDYYSKAWKSNTEDALDAAASLQGRYATDTHYFEKLKYLMDTYDLYQYDVSLEEYYYEEYESQKMFNFVPIESNGFAWFRYMGKSSNLFEYTEEKLRLNLEVLSKPKLLRLEENN